PRGLDSFPTRRSSDLPVASTRKIDAVAPAGVTGLDASGWLDLVAGLALRGPVRELAAHASFVDWRDGVLQLSLPAADDHLKTTLDRKSTRLNSSHVKI